MTSLARGRPDAGAADEHRYWIRLHRSAMACRFEITLADHEASFVAAARAALDEIDRLETELSIFRETSIISELNRRAACASPIMPGGQIAGLRLQKRRRGYTRRRRAVRHR